MAVACLLLSRRDAGAAAEVHRLNLVLSGIPTSVAAEDFNDRLDRFNQLYLTPHDFEGLKEIRAAWYFDASLRYFVRPNVAVDFGVGQIRQQTKREFLPLLNSDLQLRAEILSMPVHVGAAYYLQPYNVGDFRAQAYLGGGFLSSFYDRVRVHASSFGLDSATTAASNFQVTGEGDGPGYYVDAGVHMFFALRFSVMVSALYRSQVVRGLHGTFRENGVDVPIGDLSTLPEQVPLGGLRQFDLSGVGARMAVAIGF